MITVLEKSSMTGVDESSNRLGSMDFFQICAIVWRHKWFVLGVSVISVGVSLAYIFTAQEWYKAEVLLKPAETKAPAGLSSQLGGLGGLASLAGINLGNNNSAEPIAVLTSREFTRAFLEDQKLLPVLYWKKWDAVGNRWKTSLFSDPPDIRDAVDRFNKSIRTVQEDRKTGFVTMTVEWKDPQIAAAWANLLVERLNERMRSRALAESETNVDYLKKELASSNVVALQQSIGRVLEAELQRLMLAKATKEYSFKIIDHAIPPKRRSWPRTLLIAGAALLFGAVASILFVLGRDARGRDASKIPAQSID
jgi:uncharacterized protein involved in exopolysaccharide biosynthesis